MQPILAQHYMWGSRWNLNSCAIDSITFGLAVVHHQSTVDQRIEIESQLSSNILTTAFRNITLNNLSQASWYQATPVIRSHMFNVNRHNHIIENDLVDTDRIVNLLFHQTVSQNTTTTAWQYHYKYECINKHITLKSKYNRIISIQPPQLSQPLENIITKAICENKYRTTQCINQSCGCKSMKIGTQYTSPSIMFVFFVDQEYYPHTQSTIDNTINIKIQQITYIYKLESMTYYAGKHFLQRTMLNNGDIIQYDGYEHSGRAQQVLNSTNHFPTSFTTNGSTWMAHTAIFRKIQTIINNDISSDDNNLSQTSIDHIHFQEIIDVSTQSQNDANDINTNSNNNNICNIMYINPNQNDTNNINSNSINKTMHIN